MLPGKGVPSAVVGTVAYAHGIRKGVETTSVKNNFFLKSRVTTRRRNSFETASSMFIYTAI